MKTKISILFSTALLFISLNALPATNASVMELENTTLTFMPGSSSLSTEESAKLQQAVADAKTKGKISKIELAVWSDKELPATGHLPKKDEQLASARIKAIRLALRKDVQQLEPIKTYNMAEKTHWLGRIFNSSRAELDAAYSKKGTGDLARADYALIKQDGAPSKAVVVFKIRDK